MLNHRYALYHVGYRVSLAVSRSPMEFTPRIPAFAGMTCGAGMTVGNCSLRACSKEKESCDSLAHYDPPPLGAV